MDWTQTITIIGTIAGLFAIFTTLFVYMLNRLESRLETDLSKIDSDIKGLTNSIEANNRRLDGHATRIDQLYTMFCDLVRKK